MRKIKGGRQESARAGQLRCAIYTRKSTEEGLDQEFNSLDAQREACAAYIVSQRQEGWSLVSTRYDDGGFSGGNLERPALQRLLADVRAGKVDVIVVYKVDRLTRALSDFAKIVETLDAAGASFVSITQAFNTTTSMGRLTLNVLLSFAQFEREVIAERVRDKIAASKAKGMWMGGTVPLGYDVKDRKLIINPAEAETVRHIFRRYVELGSVPALMAALAEEGVVTKVQRLRDGSVRGGIPFVRGPLYHFLKNRIYRGEIVHHEACYAGEHEAIVDEELFDKVQARLAENIADRSSGRHARSPSLLTGMVRDEADRPLSPSHATKAGKSYRYYVSNIAVPAEEGASVTRLPAAPLEAALRASLCSRLEDSGDLLCGISLSADEVRKVRLGTLRLIDRLRQKGQAARQTLQALDLQLVVHPDRIAASCSRNRLLGAAEPGQDWSCVSGRLQLEIPTSAKRRGQELRLRIDSPAGDASRDPRLISVIIRAHAARAELQADASDAPSNRRRELARTALASYLAPDIVAAILEGRQPATLGARRLMRMPELPICWGEQRRVLGFS